MTKLIEGTRIEAISEIAGAGLYYRFQDGIYVVIDKNLDDEYEVCIDGLWAMRGWKIRSWKTLKGAIEFLKDCATKDEYNLGEWPL